MKVKFNDKTYEKNKRNGGALKNLCFDIFKQYLEKNNNLTYYDIQNKFNQWHCNNNFVVLSAEDWQNKTENLRGRYFEPIEYNGLKLYFSTQWGNNGGDCDNINNMIEFAKGENYDIEVLEWDDSSLNNFYGLWTPRNNQDKIYKCLKSGIWYRGDGNYNREVEAKKIASMSTGDKVFLYDTSEDVKVSDSPFSQYLPQEYLVLGYTVVKAKCVGIGKVVSTNIEDLSVTVDWDEDYQGSEWYLYTRQDGVWWFDGQTQNKYKAQALYDIIFNGKEQDYKWWAENGGFNMDIITEQKANKDNQIKNIILYGSPGVGKTYNHKKLIALIEGNDFTDKDIFDFIINNKDDEIEEGSVDELYELVNNEDRMKFITFHQSFGYEDFIEGFRPNEEGKIELEDGVFKNICDDAQTNLIHSIKYKSTLENEEKEEKLFELFIDEIENEIDKNEKYYINSTVYITNVEGDALRYQGANWKNSQRMKFDDIKLMYHYHGFSRKSIKHIPNISGLAKQHATYFSYLAKKFLEFSEDQNIQIDEIKKVERKNYYLVIDEINRGNISKIFGELITLIEEDKRDTLEVTLPYSKKTFKIPSNLYIIGTMNSTDKSIALIDIALRRRFTFLKMEPNLDLVKNKKARNIMQQLNEKITETLGADYVLGHSYFMKIENDDDLEFALEYKIRPLLEEYFYGDEQGLKSVMQIVRYDRDDDNK